MKLNKRFLALLLAVTMMLGMLPTVFAAEDGKITATYNVSSAINGKVDSNAPDGTIENGEAFEVTLNWNLTNDDLQNTTIYTTELPCGFILNSVNGDTDFGPEEMYKGSDKVGTYAFSYNASTGKTTVTFGFNAGLTADALKGSVNLDGIFDIDLADDNQDGYIEVPNDQKYPVYTPTHQFSYKVNLSKSGERREGNDGKIYIDYRLDIGAEDGNLTNVVVTDTPDSSATMFAETVKVTDGQYSNEAIYELTTVEDGTGSYSWTIPSIPNGKTYCLWYTVRIDKLTNSSIQNNASVRTDENTHAYANCTVSLKMPSVSKTGTLSGNRVTWTITVTFNDFPTVKVMDYDVYEYTDDNTDVSITFADNTTSTIKYSQLRNGYDLESNGNVWATLTFDSILPDDYAIDHREVENTVWVSVGGGNVQDSEHIPVITQDRIISKIGDCLAAYENPWDTDSSGNSIQEGGGPARIRYEINLNFEDQPSKLYGTPKFYDYIAGTNSDDDTAYQAGMQYDVSSFRLVYDGNTYDSSSWGRFVKSWSLVDSSYDRWLYNASYKYGGGTIFSELQDSQYGGLCFAIEFAEDAPAGEYTLIYDTTYDPANCKKALLNDRLYNVFIAPNYEYKESYTDYVLNYIYKEVRDVDENQVTWDVWFPTSELYSFVRYNGYFVGEEQFIDNMGITITDTMPEGFSLESVRIYTLENDSDYTIDVILKPYGEESYDNYYSFDEATNQLVVTLNAGGSGLGSINVLKTNTHLEIVTTYDDYDQLTPGKTSKTFTNEAQLRLNGISYPKVNASVNFTPPALITKVMSYTRDTAPRPKFTVTVNPKGVDLVDGDELTVIDTIDDEKQTFVAGSLKVNGVAHTNYDISKDGKTLTIRGLQDEMTHTIEYRTLVNVDFDSSEYLRLNNTVVLKGVFRNMDNDSDLEEVFASAKYDGRVIMPRYVNALTSYFAPVTVNKVDADTGANLIGAVFGVYKDGIKVGEITCNEDGTYTEYTIDTPNVVYTLKEIIPPDGYNLSDMEYKFGKFTGSNPVPEGVTALKGQPIVTFEVPNERSGSSTTSLTINKVGGITGEENFIMTVEGEGCNLQIVVPANGSVTIDGLLIGKTYTVTEDATWAKRYTSDGPAQITLDADVTKNTVTITNTKSIFKWLYGDSSRENRWNENGNVYEVQ